MRRCLVDGSQKILMVGVDTIERKARGIAARDNWIVAGGAAPQDALWSWPMLGVLVARRKDVHISPMEPQCLKARFFL